MNVTRRRWSDNDRYFGPFTYARDQRYRPFACVLSSADDEDGRCQVRFSGFGHTLILALPPVIKPFTHWVDTSKYSWSNNPAGGYWDTNRCDYGVSYNDGFLQVFRGRITHDSTTDRSWGKFLPWTQWRHVRHSLYDLAGAHFWTELDTNSARLGLSRFDAMQAARDRCPTLAFEFDDYDGERITATTRIEEREWRFGRGWFKWLSLFCRPKIQRSLDINFSAETGERKGSWKGGTIGHSIEMLSGELHESAFRRYCAEHGMTFIGGDQ